MMMDADGRKDRTVKTVTPTMEHTPGEAEVV
jgi:hypothetical protein